MAHQPPPHHRKRLLSDDAYDDTDEGRIDIPTAVALRTTTTTTASSSSSSSNSSGSGDANGAGASPSSNPQEQAQLARRPRREEEQGEEEHEEEGEEEEGGQPPSPPWAPMEEFRYWATTRTLRLALLVAVLGLVQAVLSAEAIFWLLLALASLTSLASLAYARLRDRGLLAYLPPATQETLTRTSLLDWLLDTSMADRVKPYAALTFGLNEEERAFLIASLAPDQRQALLAPGLINALPESVQSLLLPRAPAAVAAAAGGSCGAAAGDGDAGGRRRIEEISEAEAAALRDGGRRPRPPTLLPQGGDEEEEEDEAGDTTASETSDDESEDGGTGQALRHARLAIVPPARQRQQHQQQHAGGGLRPPARRPVNTTSSSSLGRPYVREAQAAAPPLPSTATAASAGGGGGGEPWPQPHEVDDVAAYVLRRRVLRAWGEATRAGTDAVVAGVTAAVRRQLLDRRLIYAGVALSGGALASQLTRAAPAAGAVGRAWRTYGSAAALVGTLALAVYESYASAEEEEDEYESDDDEEEELLNDPRLARGQQLLLQGQRKRRTRRRRPRAGEGGLFSAVQVGAFVLLLYLLRTGRLGPLLRRLWLRAAAALPRLLGAASQ